MKKMLLVNPDQHQTPPIFEDPEKTKTMSLDEDMKNILTRHDINDEEKVKLYESALNRYTVYRKKAELPSVSTPQPSQLGFVDDVVASAPKNLKGKAEQMARMVLKQMKWSPKGELIANDQPIVGSHIVDLVNDALRTRKTVNPIGLNTFVEKLSTINAPRELIGNTNIREALQRFNRLGEVAEHNIPPPPRRARRHEPDDIEDTPLDQAMRQLSKSRRKRVQRWLEYE